MKIKMKTPILVAFVCAILLFFSPSAAADVADPFAAPVEVDADGCVNSSGGKGVACGGAYKSQDVRCTSEKKGSQECGNVHTYGNGGTNNVEQGGNCNDNAVVVNPTVGNNNQVCSNRSETHANAEFEAAECADGQRLGAGPPEPIGPEDVCGGADPTRFYYGYGINCGGDPSTAYCGLIH